ncbi:MULTISPECIES: hypothetical protein [Sphingomonas]|uniref:Uncharacterized protein n=1 Tax=Sphingomonas trueperi TaxID=53317 RepID=A0A7X5Y2P6_9SPHN|nr:MULTISPECIES: hypothetical protein [Sphingomonas]NJB99997.1 hypothetical protein [Sphingomonas trueperi]
MILERPLRLRARFPASWIAAGFGMLSLPGCSCTPSDDGTGIVTLAESNDETPAGHAKGMPGAGEAAPRRHAPPIPPTLVPIAGAERTDKWVGAWRSDTAGMLIVEGTGVAGNYTVTRTRPGRDAEMRTFPAKTNGAGIVVELGSAVSSLREASPAEAQASSDAATQCIVDDERNYFCRRQTAEGRADSG